MKNETKPCIHVQQFAKFGAVPRLCDLCLGLNGSGPLVHMDRADLLRLVALADKSATAK